MHEPQQKKPSFIPPTPTPKDSATGLTPPQFPLQAQAKPPSASKKATRPYSSYERDLIQAKLLEGMDKAIQRQAQAQAIQSKCAHCEAEDAGQRKEDGEAMPQKLPQEIATDGFRGTPRRLPHLDKIQKSFGQDLSHVQAFIGGTATAASRKLGAAAYTCGNRIAFAKTPSVGLAAHEAAHVMQQQSGKVQLKDGLGQVGDKYEIHADAVADAVVAGKSAAPLLGEYTKVLCPPIQTKGLQVISGQSKQKESLVQLQTVPPGPLLGPGLAQTEISRQQVAAFNAFRRNYMDMREANWIGGDLYFHCKANCEAAQVGSHGATMAAYLSNSREFIDRITGDPPEASNDDQEANRYGRRGGRNNPDGSCKDICETFRPEGLPDQY